MPYEKTQWLDHSEEFPDRYVETDNGDGTITHEKSPGEIYQEGTPINAANMNKIEQGIADAHEGLSDKADTTHVHDAATASKAGFLSTEDKGRLDTLNSRVNQGVNSTDSPTFAGLTVNGTITGATFN